jgi:hypothetical protein
VGAALAAELPLAVTRALKRKIAPVMGVTNVFVLDAVN